MNVLNSKPRSKHCIVQSKNWAACVCHSYDDDSKGIYNQNTFFVMFTLVHSVVAKDDNRRANFDVVSSPKTHVMHMT